MFVIAEREAELIKGMALQRTVGTPQDVPVNWLPF